MNITEGESSVVTEHTPGAGPFTRADVRVSRTHGANKHTVSLVVTDLVAGLAGELLDFLEHRLGIPQRD